MASDARSMRGTDEEIGRFGVPREELKDAIRETAKAVRQLSLVTGREPRFAKPIGKDREDAWGEPS